MKFVLTSWMTGMWLNIALIAVIFHQCYCKDIDCNNMFPEPPYGRLECCQEEIESQNIGVTCDFHTANIKWTVTNTASGTLTAEFDLMPQSCGSTFYELKLYINESVTNAEECEENTSFQLLHSSRSVEILTHNAKCNRNVSPCGKTAVATFNYVFSGCYVLHIEAEIHPLDTISIKSQPRFIETEYKKDLLVDKKPRIITQVIPALQQIDVSVQFQSVEEFEDLHIGLRLNSDIDWTVERACYISGHDHSCCTYRTSGQFMCKMGRGMSNKPSCHVVSDAIKCTIHNITTGFYCVLVEIADDRCKTQTVWNNKSTCTFNSKIIEVEPALPPDVGTLPPEPSPAASDAILVAVVLAVVMVCLCAIVLMCRWWRRPFLESGACSCLKYNIVEIANLYYFKVEEKHSEDLVKISSEK